MIDVEKYIDSLTQSISKRFERHEEKFQGIEVSQREIKEQLIDLELARGRSDENRDIEMQQVKNIFFFNFSLTFF